MPRLGNISISGLSSGMDTEGIIKDLMRVQKMKVDRVKKKNIAISYKQEEWKKMNAKIYSFYSKDLGKFRLKSNYASGKVANSNEGVAVLANKDQAPQGSHEIEVLQLATHAQDRTQKLATTDGRAVTSQSKLADMGLQAGQTLEIHYQEGDQTKNVKISLEENQTLGQLTDKIKDQTKGKIDVNVNMDYVNGRMFFSTKKSGAGVGLSFSGQVAQAFGLSQSQVKGKNAQFRYNGGSDVFESTSNQIEVNGLKAQVKAQGKTTFQVERDIEEAYKRVTDFIKKYNDLVKEIDDKVNITIPRAQRGMEPLTDEEKKALSDDEVKKWEETLRGQVFQRDSNLKSLLADMRSSLAFSENDQNQTYKTLSSLGITTGKFREGNGITLFVDGDSDLGGSRAGEPNKLRQALADNPQEVADLLAGLGEKLYDQMTKRMKSTSLRSYMSFYDDKAIQNEYKDYERKIELMEDKMYEMEDRYRKQFAAMEKAMSQSNSTSAWLSQQLSALR